MTTVAAPPSEADTPPLSHPEGRRRDDTRLALLFILPAFIGFVVFASSYSWCGRRSVGYT
ncbi:MAG: hypothetical protein JNM77_14445 [Pseudonocardia sp.]|nr:hypothetical protein [Pseudonocardia sp.]